MLAYANGTSADSFDQLTQPQLLKVIADGATPVSQVTAKELSVAATKSPGQNGAFLLLRTTEGRLAKLLVQPGFQKIGATKHPIILVDRFATFKDGEERTTTVKGIGIPLYAGMHFNADVGHVVNEPIANDLGVTLAGDAGQLIVKPSRGAQLYLFIQMPASISQSPVSTFIPGVAFESRFFNGVYQLQSDGRRSGTLTLDVDEASGEVRGTFHSDKDGRKYEVAGKIGAQRHMIAFNIKFPQSREQFQGYMFTGDGKAIAGTCKLQDREAGFYATRKEGK